MAESLKGCRGRAVAVQHDVTDTASWSSFLRTGRRIFGYPAILVNCAGVLDLQSLEAISEQDWSRVIDVNQRGTWLGLRALAPVMRIAGGGVIVNISSVFGTVGTGASFAYHASKGAVQAMTKAAAVELAPYGIRVNGVAPGLVASRMSDALPDTYRDATSRRPRSSGWAPATTSPGPCTTWSRTGRRSSPEPRSSWTAATSPASARRTHISTPPTAEMRRSRCAVSPDGSTSAAT